MAREIEVLLFRRGKSAPAADWIASLKDARLNRIRLGNFGDCTPVGGGAHELRIDFGPGYRVYFGRKGPSVVVLLCGGDKSTQAKDILIAQKYWKDYLNAESGH